MTDSHATVIHPTAIVEKGACLGHGVKIGPYSHIGSRVTLGDGVTILSHVSVQGKTTVGARSKIWPFASLGSEPQDLKYKGEETELICGEDNMIREYANLSLGTEGGGGKTLVGSGNLLMVGSHVAHDCMVGDRCILANGVSLAGHIEVGDGAVLGGHAAIHQFVRIGSLAMLGGGAVVVQDVLPFTTVAGNHASVAGLNVLGLKRSGRSREEIGVVKTMYRLLYQSGLSLEDALAQIDAEIPESSDRETFLEFCRKVGKRGLCR